MTARPVTAPRRAQARRAAAAARRRALRRRRAAALLGTAVATVLALTVVWPALHHAVREITLPLRHEDIIRQQASEKRLDPALVAAVIYAESHFRDQTSAAGAKGLMQITPATAKFIEHVSGGTTFQISDLSTPQVNIAYGTFYLRYLLDRYGGNEQLALAAYNGGEGNVDRWIVAARAQNRPLTLTTIPFGETRAYVQRVEDAKSRYRSTYAHELGY
jgi:soluble lytic murein transglycosylase